MNSAASSRFRERCCTLWPEEKSPNDNSYGFVQTSSWRELLVKLTGAITAAGPCGWDRVATSRPSRVSQAVQNGTHPCSPMGVRISRGAKSLKNRPSWLGPLLTRLLGISVIRNQRRRDRFRLRSTDWEFPNSRFWTMSLAMAGRAPAAALGIGGFLAVPRFGAGRVASFWRALESPLVPLTRKEGFLVHAHAISIWKSQGQGAKERKGGLGI